MSLRILAVATALGLTVAACAGEGPKENLGTLLGAGLGGLAGAQIGSGSGQLAAVAGGTLLGAFLGKEIGASLDKADQAYADQAAQNTLESSPTGRSGTWSNPDSGNSGSITPTTTYQTASGEYCREYQQTVTVGGQTETAYGTACRQPDGSWKVVN
ncbi:MAG: RT0821/Lpp0805 family surface protein [Alphaproteobacteria bacterium]